MMQEIPKFESNASLLGLHEAERSARQEAIRADVARRLRKACSHLSDEAFAALVDKIVGVQLKGERGPRKPPS